MQPPQKKALCCDSLPGSSSGQSAALAQPWQRLSVPCPGLLDTQGARPLAVYLNSTVCPKSAVSNTTSQFCAEALWDEPMFNGQSITQSIFEFSHFFLQEHMAALQKDKILCDIEVMP